MVRKWTVNHGKPRKGNRLRGHRSYYRTTARGVEAVKEWRGDYAERHSGSIDRDSDLWIYARKQLK